MVEDAQAYGGQWGSDAYIRSAHARTPRPARNTVANWTVTLISAAMAVLASLALAVAIGADRLGVKWTGELAQTATITLEPGADEALRARVLDELEAYPGVASIQPIARSTAERELAARFGDDADLVASLPLAPMIDIVFHTRASEAAPMLGQHLRREGLEAHIDPHDDYARELGAPAAGLRSFAVSALAVIGLAAALMVGLACGSALAAHQGMVEILRLIGARDNYIARLFERPMQVNAFLGSAAGAAVAFALAATSGDASGEAASGFDLAPMLLDLRPRIDDWPSFVAIPLAFALIATVASRIAVAIVLRRPEA